MASLLSWAGNAVKRVANTVNNDVVRPIQRDVVAPATHVAQAAVAQANPLDGGRTYNTVMQRGAQYAPQPQQSAVHQVTHNGLTNATGSLLNNVTGIPSAIDSARLGIAELTHNQPAIDNATTSLAKNLPRFLPIGMATSFKNGFGQDIATAAAAKLGENTASKQSAYAQKMLNNHTGDKVHDSAVNAYASGVKTDLLNSSLGSAGVDMNTPTSQVVKHVAGNAANTAANVVLAGKLPGAVAAKGTLLKPALTYGGLNAAAGVAQTMADPNATALDYLKNGAVGFATGAALPVAGRAAGIVAPVVAKGAKVLTQENPAVAELLAKKQASIKAMDSAKPGMMKNLVANVNSLDSQIKAIKEGGYAKVPGAPADPAAPLTPPSKGVILKETKPRGGRQDVIVARHNPETGHLQASQESIQAPPKFLQPEGVGAKPALKPNIELDRSIQHTLKNGTSEDAIQTVMDTTGADLQNAAKYVSRVAQQSKIDLGIQDSSKNPKLGTVSVPTVKQGDLAQPVLNSKFVQEHEHRIGQQALDSYGKLTSHDQVLLKQIETGTVSKVAEKANNPAAFKQAEQSIRNYYDTRHAYDRYLGIDVGYRTNYLRQIFNKVEQNSPDSQISLKGSNKRPGYTHERTNDTLGADVHDALQKDINGASFNHAKLAYEQGINEATGGKVAKGELVRTPQDGAYQQIQNKYGQDLSVPKDTAQQINSRTWSEPSSKALQRYDSVNHMLKYVKLSGGLFHAFTEGGNFVGQQIVSGKLVTNPAATGKMFKIFFSPKAMDREMTRLAQIGTLDRAHLAGLQLRPKDIKADINVSSLDKGTSKVAKYTGIQAMHDATFQREIPYAKAKIFEQKTQGLNVNNPADLAKMREVARGVNNLFGGINREVNGIKPNTFQWLQRGLLATDFTEGKLHTLWDAATHGGPAGKLAREAVVGKALLFAVLATAGAAAGGEFQGQSGKQIAKNAAGNLLDPSFEMGGYKVGLPKTHISELIGAVKPTTHTNGAPWNASGLLTYAQDRAAAVPSEAIQLLSNKNYYGQPLYGKNTKKNGGGPISAPQTALNVGQTVLPIPFGQVTNTATGKQNAAAAAANIVGFKAKPNPANSVTLQGANTTLTDPQRKAYDSQLSATQKTLTAQLKNSPVYKNMSPNDQSNALTQLNKDIAGAVGRDFASKNGLGQYAPNFAGKQSQASAKEQAVLSGSVDPNSYVKGAKSGGSSVQYSPKLTSQDKATLTKYASTVDRIKAFNTDNKAEYQYNLARYNNDKLNGTLSQAQDIKAQDALAKQKVGADYSKNVRDLYGLSKAELSSYLSTPDGKTDKQALAAQLKAYDKALVDAGIISKGKFAKGIAPSKGGRRSSGSHTAHGRSTKTKTTGLASYLATVKSANSHAIKTPKAPSFKVASASGPKFKSVSLKQYRLQKSKIA